MSTPLPQEKYFFIRSVEHFKDKIKNPALKKQVKAPASARTRPSSRNRSASTVAAEHFTAILAEQAMFDLGIAGAAHPGIRSLRQRQGLEEMEHSSVGFDVQQAVGGSRGGHTGAVGAVAVGDLAGTLGHQVHQPLRDGRLLDPAGHEKRIWRLFGGAGFLRKPTREYGAFIRRNFHPWERDCSDVVQEAGKAVIADGVLKKKSGATSRKAAQALLPTN